MHSKIIMVNERCYKDRNSFFFGVNAIGKANWNITFAFKYRKINIIKQRYQTNDIDTLHVLSFVNVSKLCKCFLVMTCDRFAKACAHLNINPQYEFTFMSNCRIFGAGKVSLVPLSLQNCVTLSVIEPPCWVYANHLIFMADLLYSNRYLTELRCVSSIFHMENFFFIWVWTNAIRLPTWVPLCRQGLSMSFQ